MEYNIECNIATKSNILKDSSKVRDTVLNTLFNELRAYLGDGVKNTNKTSNEFTSNEIAKIFASHPIKFVTALYNYVVNSINDVFNLAEENAIVDVEVK